MEGKIRSWCENDFGVGGHGHVRKTDVSIDTYKHVLNANVGSWTLVECRITCSSVETRY